jgi:triosephosphate isomerase
MHAAIRSWITEKYGKATAEKISILYGGSCNPGNARALFACPNVDGGLIGGASLKYEDFAVLIDPKTWNI